MKLWSKRWSPGVEYVESLPHLSRLGTEREVLSSYSHRVTILNNYSNKRRPRQTYLAAGACPWRPPCWAPVHDASSQVLVHWALRRLFQPHPSPFVKQSPSTPLSKAVGCWGYPNNPPGLTRYLVSQLQNYMADQLRLWIPKTALSHFCNNRI